MVKYLTVHKNFANFPSKFDCTGIEEILLQMPIAQAPQQNI